MITLWNVFCAEWLKHRRTPAFRLLVLAPFPVVAIAFLEALTDGPTAWAPDVNRWHLLQSTTALFWGLFLGPLYVALLTALTANTEHATHQWKHIFALPVDRRTIYAAKWLVNTIMIGISSLILWGGIVTVGFLMRFILPGIWLAFDIPLADSAGMLIKIYLAFLLLISLHTYLSLRWQSFVLSLGISFAGVVGALAVQGFAPLARYCPWTLASQAWLSHHDGGTFSPALGVSLIGALLIALAGILHLARREVR